MIKDKKIFITGGAGFIANKLIENYVEQNEIIVFDNYSRDTLTNSKLNGHKNIKIIKGDVRSFEDVDSAINGANIVIHAAGIAGIDTVIKRPIDTMDVNMVGTSNVLKAASKLNNLDRFIDFSTSEVFGSMSFKSKETDDTVSGSAGEARWTYAVSKLAGEHLAHAYSSQLGMKTVTVRPFNVYGPGQTGEGAMSIFIKKALNNEDITIYGDGSQIRAWCYVDDFVDCVMRCIENNNAVGKSFNIGNSRAVITIFGLAQLVCRVLNSKSNILFKDALSADIAIRIPDISRSLDELGFLAKIDLEEGVLKTAKYFSNI